MEDCRDLWKLVTKGRPEDDLLLPWTMMAEMAKIPPDTVDWFVWECEQIQKGGYAFWFDHWRYADCPFPYPEPTDNQRRINWNASRVRAMERHGERAVMDKGVKVAEYIKGTSLADEYWVQPDPFEWAMKMRLPN